MPRPNSRRRDLSLLAALVIAMLPATASAASEKILHQFVPLAKGAGPVSGLTADTEGNLFGATGAGGEYGLGAVYKLRHNSDGTWSESVIHSFAGSPADGWFPQTSVTIDAQGNLYGTTMSGGTIGGGVVYQLVPQPRGKWTETILHSFFETSGDGIAPSSGVVFDSAGNLYGTTLGSGGNDCGIGTTSGCGTVYELSPASGGWTEKVIYYFRGDRDGAFPNSNLAINSAGNLYGTTMPNSPLLANVFELSPSSSGWSFSLLHVFTPGTDGNTPRGLTLDANGDIYGATEGGGTTGFGTVFKLFRGSGGAWSEKILYNFQGTGDGGDPFSAPTLDAAGNLYGTVADSGATTCAGGCGVVYKLTPDQSGNWNQSVLYSFQGGRDGAKPVGGIALDHAGNLYGTTVQGGTHDLGGTVFSLTGSSSNSWSKSTIFTFPATDGEFPLGPLTADSNGNLYGTTEEGGSGACPFNFLNGCGTVLKLTRNANGAWQRTIIYNFSGEHGDGVYPQSGVILDSVGNLYGTTTEGGRIGYGTVFRLTPTSSGSWTETVLYNFGAAIGDGSGPQGLVLDNAGNLYGTTYGGGNNNDFACNSGCGTVFKLSPSGSAWKETIVYSFKGTGDGQNPQVGLTIDPAGNLYGTADAVFKLTPTATGSWTETVISPGTLYSWSNLILDASGNLYGAGGLGAIGYGAVFELSPTSSGPWNETDLYSFASISDSSGPWTISFDKSGNIYGTSGSGGILGVGCAYGGGCGTVFKLTPGANGTWTESTVYSFAGSPSDGGTPQGGVVSDASGNLYGTTFGGGPSHVGTMFQITP